MQMLFLCQLVEFNALHCDYIEYRQYLMCVDGFYVLFWNVILEYICYLLFYLCDNKKKTLSFFVFAVKYRKRLRADET